MSDKVMCSACAANCPSLIKAHERGWDWFTGYLEERFVACASCQGKNHDFVAAMRKKSLEPRPMPSRKPKPKANLIVLP